MSHLLKTVPHLMRISKLFIPRLLHSLHSSFQWGDTTRPLCTPSSRLTNCPKYLMYLKSKITCKPRHLRLCSAALLLLLKCSWPMKSCSSHGFASLAVGARVIRCCGSSGRWCLSGTDRCACAQPAPHLASWDTLNLSDRSFLLSGGRHLCPTAISVQSERSLRLFRKL